MAITFIPKINNTEIEVEGYGTIKVRQYGAGEELEISKDMRELEELQNKAENFLKMMKEKYNDDESQLTEDEKKEFQTIQAKVVEFSNKLHEIICSTISSDDPSVAERLLKELPMEEIRRLVTASRGGDNA